ncbi:MAG TPA: hypothetical protein DDW42_03680 [Desulfobacteraceae bacterium]|nr:hypothetical protein [Desulfobacteraceae bacterium]
MRKTIYFPLFIFVLFSFSSISAQEAVDFARLRDKMVERQIISRGIRDAGVIKAMQDVPRHLFVPLTHRNSSHNDCPVPIGEGQTISQPFWET